MVNSLVSESVIYAGIVVGGLTVLGAVWVWAKKQVFGLGGSLLSFFGTVLIGLSVFSKAQITIGDTTIVLESLQRQVETLEEDKIELASQVAVLSRNVDAQREGFSALSSSMLQQYPQLDWQPMVVPESIDYDALQRLQQHRIPSNTN